MRWSACAAVLALVVAGCADGSGTPEEQDGFEEVEADSSTGGIRGVVVDAAIVPVPEATVVLDPGPDAVETVTDAEGRFSFGRLAPGAHFLQVSKYTYETVQVSTVVEAGVTDPPVVRVQLTRLSEEEPYSQAFQFSGRVVCSYSAVIITAPCITDYTTILCGGGCLGPAGPILRGIQGDTRDWVQEIGPGWQSHIIEMTWEPSARGTSNQMGFTVSHSNRTASHWYGSFGGEDPVLGRFDCCGPHPSHQNAPDGIPAEGLPDLLTFVNVRGSGVVDVAIEQDFEAFTHTFYHIPAPEGWSFVAGDSPPF